MALLVELMTQDAENRSDFQCASRNGCAATNQLPTLDTLDLSSVPQTI
jgi:hypothetical protein